MKTKIRKRRVNKKTRKPRVKRYPSDSFKSGPGEIHSIIRSMK